jgi:hypothetical protein
MVSKSSTTGTTTAVTELEPEPEPMSSLVAATPGTGTFTVLVVLPAPTGDIVVPLTTTPEDLVVAAVEFAFVVAAATAVVAAKVAVVSTVGDGEKECGTAVTPLAEVAVTVDDELPTPDPDSTEFVLGAVAAVVVVDAVTVTTRLPEVARDSTTIDIVDDISDEVAGEEDK